MTTLPLVLTSSVISAIISALIGAFFLLKSKELDYKFNYYKEIISKRLSAYQYLETQVSVLKSTVLDKDGLPYYLIFAYGYDEFIKFQQNLIAAMAYSIWIEEETVEIMHELNDVFYSINIKINNSTSNQELEDIGKKYYNMIAEKRKKLEYNVRKDLAELYNLKRFFKSKTSSERRTVKVYNP